LLQQAEQAHRQAQSLDRQNLRYPVGIARTLRKQVNGMPDHDHAAQLLAGEKLMNVVLQSTPELPAAHNELGEIHLTQGRLAQARQAFQRAARYGEKTERKNTLYVYYCNLANAQTREPADTASYHAALKAANSAIALGTEKPADAHYYRGFALWKLAQTAEAMGAFSDVLNVDSTHVGTLLARCQIVFEMKAPDEATQDQIDQAYSDAKRVLELPDLKRDDMAKAEYVNSLGWLRTHIKNQSERALVECLRLLLNASKGSSSYRTFATKVFQYADDRSWLDAALKEDSRKLREQLQDATSTVGN
jgi:tetratricopeptide (TPR) repeat protein